MTTERCSCPEALELRAQLAASELDVDNLATVAELATSGLRQENAALRQELADALAERDEARAAANPDSRVLALTAELAAAREALGLIAEPVAIGGEYAQAIARAALASTRRPALESPLRGLVQRLSDRLESASAMLDQEGLDDPSGPHNHASDAALVAEARAALASTPRGGE
jgi:hypothetical protein